MNNHKEIKDLIVVVFIVVLVVNGYKYWGKIKPVLDGVVGKFDEVKSAIDILPGEKDDAERRYIYVKTDDNEYELVVDVSDYEEEWAKGLMFRRNLCNRCGMLFVFPEDRQNGFWMKNCLISLDLLFISSDGEIVDIKKNFEPCDAKDCPQYIPITKYRYVIEVNGGWTDENQVSIGDLVVGIRSDS